VPAAARFIDPAVLAGIQDLQLIARIVVGGFLLGLHPSRRPGSGIEFSQHRSYEPGDDPRRVDWKMYARSDRFFVRESEVERNVTVRLVLDTSASMAHRDEGVSKLDYARWLVACLGYLAEQQGDVVGFHAASSARIVDLPPRRHRHQAAVLLQSLESLRPEGVWPDRATLGARLAATRSREIVVFVSDLHEKRGEIVDVVTDLRALKHEVLVLHLVGRNELELRYEGQFELEDLETGERVEGSAEELRPAYLRALARELASLRGRLLEHGVAYELIPTDQPLDHALQGFVQRRMRLP
jgi:uncharacterized protein (DUF58 family)